MMGIAIAVVTLVVVVLIIGTLGHVLLLAALVGGGFFLGRGYERSMRAVGTRRARRTLGS